MDVKKHHQKSNFFVKWFLNNRFSIALLNILLFILIILVFNQISFVLNPFWTFFNAIFPPILVASIQYYLMDPVVDWMEKKLKVPRIITIILLFVIVVGGLIQISLIRKNLIKEWNNIRTKEKKITLAYVYVLRQSFLNFTATFLIHLQQYYNRAHE